MSVWAFRMISITTSYIHLDQSGFIPDRFLRDNLRRICNIVSFLDKTKIPVLFFFVDAEKAFDQVEWRFSEAVLDRMGWGPQVRSWIRMIYGAQQAVISVQGYTLRAIKLNRGARQGCPLSSLLLNLVTEILAIAIRTLEEVKGIKIHSTEHKMALNADDTVFF